MAVAIALHRSDLLRAVRAGLNTGSGQSAARRLWLAPHDYVQKRASSYDRTGGNDDFRKLRPAKLSPCSTLLARNITHIWITIASPEKYHLKKLVLRMFWDDETSPSVEAPVGDFFGLGLGDYFSVRVHAAVRGFR